MSETEINKGKLILVSNDVERFAEQKITEHSEFHYDTKEEQFRDTCEDLGFQIFNNKVYLIDWEIRGETDEPEFAYVTTDENGTIHFHTMHHNGGAHWSEVVEDALLRSQQQNLYLTNEQMAKVNALLDNPPVPNEALRKLMEDK